MRREIIAFFQRIAAALPNSDSFVFLAQVDHYIKKHIRLSPYKSLANCGLCYWWLMYCFHEKLNFVLLGD